MKKLIFTAALTLTGVAFASAQSAQGTQGAKTAKDVKSPKKATKISGQQTAQIKMEDPKSQKQAVNHAEMKRNEDKGIVAPSVAPESRKKP